MELKNEQAKAYCHLLNGKDKDSVTFFKVEAGERFSKRCQHAIHIVIVMDGITNVSYGTQTTVRLIAGDMFVIPPYTEIYFDVFSSLSVVHFRILDKYNLCKGFPLTRLFQQSVTNIVETHSPIIKANKIIMNFVITLKKLVDEGVQCLHYFDLKQHELLYFLGLFYDERDLRAFFSPIANTDIEFQRIIYEHFDEIKTIEDVQYLTGYSYSGVKKKFEKLYGMSFTQWFTQQKSYQVYQAINGSHKTFKEIARSLGFSSSSHLDLFCKKIYKMSPGEIRKKNRRETSRQSLEH